jgi:hypothetical protein
MKRGGFSAEGTEEENAEGHRRHLSPEGTEDDAEGQARRVAPEGTEEDDTEGQGRRKG